MSGLKVLNVKYNPNKVKRVRLTVEDLQIVEWVLDCVLEWACHDDRPDHGIGRLQKLRESPRPPGSLKDRTFKVWRKIIQVNKK